MGLPAEEGQIRRAQRWCLAGPRSQRRPCSAPDSRLRERLPHQPCIRQHRRQSKGSRGVPDRAVGFLEHRGDPGARQEEEGEAPKAGRAHPCATQAQHPAHGGRSHAAHCRGHRVQRPTVRHRSALPPKPLTRSSA